MNMQAHKPLTHECMLDYSHVIDRVKREMQEGLWTLQEVQLQEARLKQLKERSAANLDSWTRVQISRHPARPKGLQVIQAMTTRFEELFGDRNFRDDPSIVGGLAHIGQMKVVCMAQEKGSDLDSRMYRNFGMMQPEGYRKSLRLMQLAEKFGLPVVCLIDTPGAYAGLEAEERGQAWAIAENLKAMARLRTPIVSVILGEGCSGGALGIGLADSLGMLEHSYYSVISPEGCASILWKDTSKKELASEALKLTSQDLLGLNIIDEIIPEPLGGAHLAPEIIYQDIQEFILRWILHLRRYDISQLLQRRYDKFRVMGRFEQSREALL